MAFSQRALSFTALAQRIRGWTANLLACAIVLAIGLALGWQTIGLLNEKQPQIPRSDAALLPDVLPTGPEREFMTKSGLLRVERQPNPDEALNAMRAFCRQPGDNKPRSEAGPGERTFVAQLLEERPLEESPPIALYRPPGQSRMVIGIDQRSRRIISWSWAMPADDGAWSLYHFRPK
jgi:hypothetical protein